MNKNYAAAVIIAVALVNPVAVSAEAFTDTLKSNEVSNDISPETEEYVEETLVLDLEMFTESVYGFMAEPAIDYNGEVLDKAYFDTEEKLSLNIDATDVYAAYNFEESLTVNTIAENVYENFEEELTVSPVDDYSYSNEESLPVANWMLDVDYMKK